MTQDLKDFNFVVYDIETVANSKAKEYFAKKKFEAPKNYKDELKIAEYVQAARHEETQKAALRWWTGQVVCISARPLGAAQWAPKDFVGPDEAGVLRAFFAMLEALPRRPTLIGKQSSTFDLPFLIGRAIAHDLGIPSCMRPYRPIDDVNQIFGYSARCDQIGRLEDYAFGMGIAGKTGHGTDVQNWVNQAELGDDGGWQKIANYCADDNAITYELLRRWLKPFPASGPRLDTGAPRASEHRASAPQSSSPPQTAEIPFGPPEAVTAAGDLPPYAMEF
jgi:hypothetical protein